MLHAESDPAIFSSLMPADSSAFRLDGTLFDPALSPPLASAKMANGNALVVIDAAVADADTLAASVMNADVIVLDDQANGIAQITALLKDYRNLSSLHIVSHGDVGKFNVGTTTLSSKTLPFYTDQLTQWQAALSNTADILIYGCNVADGVDGKAFVNQLSQITGADIAASEDLTGNAALGGDWDLEIEIGAIESKLAFSNAIQSTYTGIYNASTDDLVMHLTLDETSGTVAADTSPYGNNNVGTLQGDATFIDTGTALQGAVQLDGSGDYVTVGKSNSLNNGTFNQRTVSAWFKVDDTNVTGQKQVIFEAGGASKGINIYVDNGQLYVGRWSSGQGTTFLSTTAIQADTWHHVALVLDADDSTTLQNDAFKGYLDGVEFGSGTGVKLTSHSNPVGIGAVNEQTRFHSGTQRTGGADSLAGSIGDVKVYNRALVTTEIASLASLFGGGSDTTAPTATVSAVNLTTAGSATYTFTVDYADNVGLDASTLDGNDIRVTGPNGFDQLATFVSLATNNQTATYQLSAPNSSWAAADNGTYEILLEANEVSDTSGNAAVAGNLGTFTIDIAPAGDTIAPTATVTAVNLTTAGSATYTFTVDYADNVGLDASTLDGNDIRVTGPNGFDQLATFVSLAANDQTATYQLSAPNSSWAAADNGTYEILLEANEVSDTSGNAAVAGNLGTFTIDIAPVSNNEVSTDDLVMHLTLDETSGAVAADTSPHGDDNGGTLEGDATFAATGTALQGEVQLDGTGDYVAVDTSSSINDGIFTQRTVSAWFKVDDTNVTGQKQVIFEAGGVSQGINIYIDNGQLYVGRWNVDHANTFLSTAAIQADTWHHVALVLDADDSTTLQNDAFKGYLDGVEFGTGAGVKLTEHGNPIGIGALNAQTRFHSGTQGNRGDHSLAGSIGDVKVYNRVLNEGEISTLASTLASDESPITVITDLGEIINIRDEAQSLWRFEGRVGGQTSYEFAIGPEGAQSTLVEQADHNWVNGEAVTWSMEQVSDQIIFTIAGEQLAYPVSGLPNLNTLHFLTKVNTTLANKVGEGTTISLAINSVNSDVLDTPIDLASTGPQNGQDLDQVVIFQGQSVSSLSGTATIAWPDNAPNPFAQNGQGRVNFLIIGRNYTPTGDTIAPTATVTAPTVTTADETTYTFTVNYSDNVAVDLTSLDDNDIRVTGPAGFEQSATLVSVDDNTAVATYQITAPGGTWDVGDNGIYEILLEANEVSDTSGNVALDGSVGFFDVAITENILLTEGSDFQVVAEKVLNIPPRPAIIRFTYAEFFDATDGNAINDAFEVALLDSQGNSLVHTYADGHDAFFNVTEGQPTALGAGVTVNGDMVELNVSDLVPGAEAGTEARLVFRLVNNDQDTATEVRIQGLEILAGSDNGTLGVVPQRSVGLPAQAPDFNQLEDVSGWLETQYGRTSFNDQTNELFVEVAAQNTAAYEVRDRLVMVIENISDPTVTLANADGQTPEGKAYVDLSSALADGVLLGDTTSEFYSLVFRNPNEVQFDYDVSFLSTVNTAPEFVSAPALEAVVGQGYRYDADATDAEGDALTYILLSGPDGIAIDDATGEITWQPALADVGTHQVTIQAEDGHGGIAEQVYTLTVQADVPNRPPVFTSTPVVDANVNTLYEYDVDATDADGDTLTYSLTDGPTGATIDAQTGLIQWTPDADQLGDAEVTVTVEDGQGDTATQTYQLQVNAEVGNNAPIFVSNPITQFQLPGLSNPVEGDVSLNRLDLDLALGDLATEVVSLVLPNPEETTIGSADIVLLVDESGSMSPAQTWLTDMVQDLEIALQSAGITENRYALGGFGGFDERLPGHLFNFVGGNLTFAAFAESNARVANNENLDALLVPQEGYNTSEISLLADGTHIIAVQNNVTDQPVEYAFDASLTNVESIPTTGLGDFVGTIATGETDTYTFTASAGLPIYLDNIGNNSDDLRLSLTSPDGSTFWGNSDIEDRIPFILPESGTYELEVYARASGLTGDYEFSLIDMTSAPTLLLDTPVTGQLNPGVESQVYQFEGTAGQRLLFQGDQSGSSYRFYDPSGQEVKSSSTSGTADLLLPSNGTYFLVVDGNSSAGPVDYSFEVTTPETTTRPLLVNETVEDSLGELGERNIYTFTATAGQQFYFDGLASDSSFIDAQLIGPRGQRLFDQDVNRNVTPFTVEEDGTYHLIVDANNQVTGNYSFRLLNIADAESLAFDSPIVPSIEPGSASKLYQFEGIAGQRLFFNSLSSQSSGNYRLYDSSGAIAGGTSLASDSETTLLRDGLYSLVVDVLSTSGSEDYTFEVITPDTTTRSLMIGETVIDAISELSEQDIYTFTAAAGQQFTFNGLSGDASIHVQLTSPTGQELFSRNQDVSRDVAAFTVEESGLYHLVVDGSNRVTGDYSFQLLDAGSVDPEDPTLPLDVNTRSLTLGETVAGTIGEVNERDVFTFTAIAGQQLYFDGIAGDSSRIDAELVSPDGDTVFRRDADSDTEPFTLEESGTYHLFVEGFGGVTGDYSFRLLDIADAAILPFDTLVSETFEPGLASQIYQFEGTAGQRLFFDVTSLSGATFFLYDPSGNYVTQNSGVRNFEETLASDGTYSLIVEGSSTTSPVSYSFEVITPDTGIGSLTLGETVSGTISELAEFDVYTFTATAGQQFYFDGLTSDSSWIEAELYNPTGSILFDDDVASDQTPFTVEESGLYRLVVTGNNNGTGDYSFRLWDLASVPVLPLDTPVQGSFDGEEVQLYRVEGTTAQTLTLTPSIDSLFGSAAAVSQARSFLTSAGGQEDGYDAINTALNELSFRPDAAVNFVLVTNEDRDVLNTDLSFGSIQNALNANHASLNTVVASILEDSEGNPVLGIDAVGQSYQADGNGGFTTSPGGTVIASAGTTEADYMDLALSLGGAHWDIFKISEGGETATSFTNAFVEVLKQDTLEQLPIEIIASDPTVQFENLTGEVAGNGSGETVAFEAQFTGDGTARSFDLLFVRPGSNQILGSIPVTINNDYQYAAQAVDADGDVLTYRLVDGPSEADIDPTTGQILWEPTTDGTYDFTLEVADGRGGRDQQSFTVTVQAGVINTAPEITSANPTEAEPNQDFRYQVTATDADGDALNYYLGEAPEGMTIDRNNGQVTWVPTADQSGDQQVTVRVLDGRGGEDTQPFTLTVDQALPNLAPDIVSTPLETIEFNSQYRYQVQAQDADGDGLQYELTAAPDGMVIAADTGEIRWQPSADQLGEHTVVVRVSDGRGGLDVQVFSLQVQTPNFAPAITSTANDIAAIARPYEYQVQAQDADGEVVSYRLENAPSGMGIDADTGVIRWTPAAGQLGSATATVVAIDDRGAETTQTFTLDVVASLPNEAPDITSTPRQTTGVNAPYTYQLDATDPNGDPLTYAVNGPAGLTIDATGLVQWVPTVEQLGSHTVELTVSDGQGGTAEQTFEVSVNSFSANRAPEIISAPASLNATVAQAYDYDARAVDPDGDLVRWQLATAPAGMSLNATTGTLRWQPGADQLGLHTITLEAIDAQGAVTRQTFELTVRGTNLAPVINSIPVTTASADRAYAYQLQATDAEGDTLTYALLDGPAGMTIDATTGLVSWQPTLEQVGTVSVDVAVTDPQGVGSGQRYTVVVSTTADNGAPTITSRPEAGALIGSPYTYQVIAEDPDEDTLTYTLVEHPAGMTIDSETGLLNWVPPAGSPSSVTVAIQATDPSGLGSTQRFILPVATSNGAPTIVSDPVVTAAVNQLYQYDLQAQDPDGDALTYELVQGPEGMTIDDLGRIRWTPTTVGSTDVEVEVRDVYGATATEAFTLTATVDDVAPEVAVFPNVAPANVGEDLSVFVAATDNVGVVSRSLTLDGTPVTLTNGAFTFTPTQIGDILAVATATDAAGNTTQTETTLQIRDFTNPGMVPQVSLASLAGQVLTSPTDILGTVQDDNLVNYTLSLALIGSEDFREIYRGTETVANGVLGELDTSLFQNDTYTLRLTAEDGNANIASIDTTVDIAGDLKLGNFTLSFTDMELPVPGIPVTVTRTYDSLTTDETDDFGYGWRLEFRDTNLRTSLGPDEEYDAFGFRRQALENGTRIYLTLPGGKREAFTFAPEVDPRSFIFPDNGGIDTNLYRAAFKADDGVTSTLSVKYSEYDDLLQQDGNGRFFQFGNPDRPFNPQDTFFGGVYVLTTKDGIEYEIDANTGDLLTAKDLNGNTVTYEESGIYSDTGTQITFGRDAQGRITSAIDTEGRTVQYEYDDNGDLIAVTDREGHTTQFDYSDEFDHYLDEVIDPLGRTGVKSEYDEQGRLKQLLDVNGEAVELVYDPENSTQTVEDVFGNPTTYVYDDRGNVLTEVDAVGQVIQRSYDEDDNVLSETIITEESGPEGWTTSYTYDEQGNQLTMTDAEGSTTFYSYGDNSRLLSETDALGNTTTYIYDSRGNLLTTTDAEGEANAFDYSQSGNLLSLDDALGNSTSFSYDSRGQVTRMTDAEGNVTQYEYDADGNRIQETRTVTTPTGVQELITRWTYDGENRVETMTDAEGGVTTYEYDANGNQVAVVDPLGNRTEMRYDDRGQLIETIFADDTPADLSDNSRTIDLYDRGGRLRASIDQAGHVTHYVYDAVDQLIETIHPDEGETLEQLLEAIAPGETLETVDWTEVVYSDAPPAYLSDNDRVRTEYTQDGRVKASIDERGNRTEYRYDAIGRLIETIYADETPEDLSDNPTMTVAYDAVGRRLAETDALGRTTRYEYDTLGRVIETTFHDGSSTQVSYDAAGRRESVTDQAGKVTEYLYDNVGRLVGVRDALGFLTQYRYDEVGRLVAAEDAEGNITEYEYDQVGRRTAVELPLAQRAISTYDLGGNRQTYTDFNGEVTGFDYDAQNRLIFKDYEDDANVSYTYTANGLIESITDGRGTTSYKYDVQNRLLSRTDPDGPYLPSGATIEYSYDEAGNRTAVTTPNGSVSYGYDERNRLTTVVDEDFNLTTYGYDDANNLTRTEFPNGVVETREYDDLNRLVFLENKVDDTVVSSYRYELNAAGHRLSVTEDDGRQVSYTYDDLYRLTEENINNGERVISYTFDNVGNRLTRNDSAEGITTYTYDDSDRLQTETLSQDGAVVDTTTYTYDDNGNLTQQVKNVTETTTYTWNDDNRLVAVTTPEGNSVTYEYDDSGIRVGSTVNGETTDYLIDKNRAYAQVLEEFVNDELAVSYVYGHDLISQTRTEDTSYYQVDGLGSTRVLTDESGTISDNYDYDAFGNLINSSGETENSYQFAGEQFDENLDNYYLRQRFYDQNVGRFARRDTYEGRLNEPITLHKYLYANANPVSFIDPSGLVSFLTIPQLRELGNEIHEIIGRNFVSKDFTNHQADFLTSRLTIKRILREADGLPNGHFPFNGLRPDLADYETREIYEIKSRSREREASLQILINLAALNRAPGQKNEWNEGNSQSYSYDGGPIPLKYGKIAIVSPTTSNGLILYQLINDPKDKMNTVNSVAAASISLLIALTIAAAARNTGPAAGLA